MLKALFISVVVTLPSLPSSSLTSTEPRYERQEYSLSLARRRQDAGRGTRDAAAHGGTRDAGARGTRGTVRGTWDSEPSVYL